MAKRQLSSIQIDGIEYNLSILSDYSVLDSFVVYGEFENGLAEYPATKNTDFAPIKADATTTTNYDTNLIAKFQRYVRNQEKAIMWYYGSYPMQYVAYNGSTTHVYYSITLDDDKKEAWVTAIVYQNDAFEKNIVDYAGEDLYNAFYLPYVPPTPPGPQGDATCKVNYYLQDDEYTYSKITFKEDTPPIDMNDGYVQDILANQSSVNIENLVEGQKYYFTIFTNKSESEPFSYIVGEAPIPEVNGIIIYKNGRIYRDDSIVSSDPYCSVDGYTPGRARLDSWNIEYKSDSIEISAINSSYTDGTPYFSVNFNLSTKTGTRITKPLIATVSQLYNSRTVLTNVLKIKFEINLTMQSGNYNKFSPRFYYTGLHNGNSVEMSSYIAQYLTDKSHVSGNYIIADPSESFGISETLEIPVYYYDYNTGSSYSFTSEAPHLWFDLGQAPTYSGPSNFNLKINIKQIVCEMNQVSLPKKDDEFYICVHGYGENGPVLWTIEELYSEVKKLGHNSFVLYPSYKTYSNTMYSIWPFTMNVTDDLYVCKDKYITNQNYYFAIGVSSSGAYSQDWFYDSNNDMTKTLKQSSGKWGLTLTKTVNNVQYAYNYISQYNNRQTFVFYTEGYKRLYVNNILLDEK